MTARSHPPANGQVLSSTARERHTAARTSGILSKVHWMRPKMPKANTGVCPGLVETETFGASDLPLWILPTWINVPTHCLCGQRTYEQMFSIKSSRKSFCTIRTKPCSACSPVLAYHMWSQHQRPSIRKSFHRASRRTPRFPRCVQYEAE